MKHWTSESWLIKIVLIEIFVWTKKKNLLPYYDDMQMCWMKLIEWKVHHHKSAWKMKKNFIKLEQYSFENKNVRKFV